VGQSKKTPIIFVTGASRSGTTMTSRILGNHTEILSTRELHYFGDLCNSSLLEDVISNEEALYAVSKLHARFQRGLWKDKRTNEDDKFAKKVINETADHDRTPKVLFLEAVEKFLFGSQKTTLCEQTPRNIFYADQLLDLHDQVRIVHLTRDPRAVLASQKNRWRQRAMGRKNIPLREVWRVRVNYHPLTICKLWVKANRCALRLATHPRLLIMKFEDIVNNPIQCTRQMCDFLGISFQPKMIEVPQMGSSHQLNTGDTGVSAASIDKWKDQLTQKEIAVCELLTKNLMEKFGYTTLSSTRMGRFSYIHQLATYPLHFAGVAITNPRRAWIQANAMWTGLRTRNQRSNGG